MKITGNGVKAIETYAAQAKKGVNKAGEKGNTGPGQGDRVEISKEAREIRTYMDALQREPAIREELVATIKKKVQAGAYQPATEKIVDGLINEILLDKKG